jgi:hypothetical protein
MQNDGKIKQIEVAGSVLYETVVRRCMIEGLVGGDGFAVDASMIVADAHRQRGVATPDQLDPAANRAVTEYLATLDDAALGLPPRSSRNLSRRSIPQRAGPRHGAGRPSMPILLSVHAT